MADINVTLNGGTAYSVPLDTTLTQSGAAADAKATGDAIAECATQADLYDVERGLTADVENISSAVNTLNGESDGSVKQMISEALEAYRSVVLDAAHPIGSLWISTTDADPADLFGGTWEPIEGRFLLSASEEHPAGTEGGAATHKHGTQPHVLTDAELPAHDHGEKKIVGAFGMSLTQIPVKTKNDGVTDMIVIPEMVDSETGASVSSICTGAHMVDGNGDGAKRLYHGHTGLTTAVYSGVDGVLIDATHTHESVGSDAAHTHGDTLEASTLPPFLAVNVWKRVS